MTGGFMNSTIMARAPGGIKATMAARRQVTPGDGDRLPVIILRDINQVRATWVGRVDPNLVPAIIPRDINQVLVMWVDRLGPDPVLVMSVLPREPDRHPVMLALGLNPVLVMWVHRLDPDLVPVMSVLPREWGRLLAVTAGLRRNRANPRRARRNPKKVLMAEMHAKLDYPWDRACGAPGEEIPGW
jgi:hypothetical protein